MRIEVFAGSLARGPPTSAINRADEKAQELSLSVSLSSLILFLCWAEAEKNDRDVNA